MAGPNGGIRPLRLSNTQSEPEFEVSGSPGRYKHRFRHKTAPDEESQFKLVLWREGRGLKIILRDAVLPLDAPTGGVAIRWRWESAGETERLCAVFTGASINRDKVGSFSGSDAPVPALVDCSDESIAGIVSPAVCGDGIISGTEECDGPTSCDLSENILIGYAFSDCGTVAAGNECTCCSRWGGFLMNLLPCCQPSVVIAVPAPPIGGHYFCVSNSCDPPFECDEGDSCLADLTCCGGEDSQCGGQFSGGVVRTCCGSLTCTPDLSTAGIVYSCQPPTACAVNADCITDFCDGGLCADQ